MIELYDSKTIDQLPWPNTTFAERAKRFILPLMRNGTKHYIDNIETQLVALLVDAYVLPVTVNEEEYDNSYVCSPYSHYISYANDQLQSLTNTFLKKSILGLVNTVGWFFRRTRINQVVVVNNWLFATNLYPELTKEQIEAIRLKLIEKFPKHTIIFRSIDAYQQNPMQTDLKSSGFDLIGSRVVYFTDTKSDRPFQSRMFKSDQKVLRKSSYVPVQEISLEEAERIASLYRALNIEKHSEVNPRFNSNFIKFAIDQKILNMTALKKGGGIDAVMGYFTCDNVMTSPFFGYDTSLSQDLGLYRQISTLLLLHAKEKNMLLHQSSGGGSYKKLRRAESAIEYQAVFHKHLPLYRRIPWFLLKMSVNTIGIRMMQKLS